MESLQADRSCGSHKNVSRREACAKIAQKRRRKNVLGPRGHGCRQLPKDALHHCQMFQVVVRLEGGLPGEELEEDAPHAPEIARVRPAQPKHNFRRAVVPRRDDGGVVIVLIGCAAQVNDNNVFALDHAGAVVLRVPVVLPIGIDEENVFEFKVSVDEAHLVQECHCAQQLTPKYLHFLQGKRAVRILPAAVIAISGAAQFQIHMATPPIVAPPSLAPVSPFLLLPCWLIYDLSHRLGSMLSSCYPRDKLVIHATSRTGRNTK